MTSTDTRTRPTTSRATTTEGKATPGEKRAGKTPEERAAEVDALAEQLTDAVAELTTSAAWVAMLRVAARFTRYSPKNVLLLWMQAEQRGVTLTRVAGYRAWQAMGRQVGKSARSFAVLASTSAAGLTATPRPSPPRRPRSTTPPAPSLPTSNRSSPTRGAARTATPRPGDGAGRCRGPIEDPRQRTPRGPAEPGR